MWDKVGPYVRSLFAAVVAITVGVAAGSLLPPNRADVQAAYSSGLSDAQIAAQESFSSQLEVERQQAEQSLSSALQRQETLFSQELEEAVSEASSEAFQKGKQAVVIPSSSSDMGEDSYTEPYPGTVIEPYQYEEMVWIPRSGSRYHSNPECSGMKDPQEVPLSEAEAQGYTPCQKCYG